MMSFRNQKLAREDVPPNIASLIRKINKHKNKRKIQAARTLQISKQLEKIAIVQSTKISNRIEGIFIDSYRLNKIMTETSIPQDRSEREVAGYRDVLKIIRDSYDVTPINSNIILQFHRDLFKYISSEGGKWKKQDNLMVKKLPAGERDIEFKTVSAIQTPFYIKKLCGFLSEELKNKSIEPLILIGAFIFDFLRIHPFNAGNGRMARLLILLLLCKYGYEIGRYISLEEIIEENEVDYYKSLSKSAVGWQKGNHNIFFWLDCFLNIILTAYKELEDRITRLC